jgi:hypothetical protein
MENSTLKTRAVQHSIKYGEWIVDHPLAVEFGLAKQDED